MIDSGLIIGRVSGMENVVSQVLANCRSASVQQSLEVLDDDDFFEPQVLVVLQHWSDEYTSAEVQRLINMFPLTRIICCFGPWCASDGRTRDHWPQAMRVAVDDFSNRFERELAVIEGRRSPIEKTAGLDELFEFEHGG